MARKKDPSKGNRIEWVRAGSAVAAVVISVVGIAISVGALALSWQSNRTAAHANEIAESANKPHTILVDVLANGMWSHREGDQQVTACRHAIRFANVGGARASLHSVSTVVRILDNTVSLSTPGYNDHGRLGDVTV